MEAGIRVELDGRSETLGFKIRAAEKQRIPLSLVVGEQEAQAGTVSPRLRKSKDKIDAMALDALTAQLATASAERSMGPLS
jgi:threonyl-tRNA synthetase